MKNVAKYAVLALGPIALIVGLVVVFSGGTPGVSDSVLYYNIITGETERMSISEAGVSVRKDDQGRRVMFIVVGEDGNTNVKPGEPMYIKEQDHVTFDLFVERGEFTLDEVKVDPETYMIVQ
ncbi:MAG: hypothetical protein Tsb0013_25100 [Phycisphaerales bacterium]